MSDRDGWDPAGDAEPGSRRRGLPTLVLLLLIGWITGAGRTLPDPVGPGAPDTVYSSGRAMLDVVDIARAPHPPGSPAHDRVRALLTERLSDLGLTPEIQTTTSMRRFGDQVVAATVRNVLARVPGTSSTGSVLLTAHYDGRGHARAAGDDGAGVAAILEAVRAFLEGPAPANDVVVLLTDGEELGLLGARAFVAEHEWLDDVAVVLSFEMRGGGGTSIMFETGSENGWIVDAFGEGSPRPFANSLSVEVYRRLPNDTDFTPFRDRGIQGLNFAGIDRAHVYHQAWDDPARLDERTLQHHGIQLLGMLRHLANRDLSDVHAPDRAYFTLPGIGLVHYPPSVVYGLAVLLLLAFAGVGVVAWLRGGRLLGMAAGAGLAVVATGVTAGVGHLLFLWVRRFHPELGALHGSAFHVEGWYVAAVVAVGAAVTLLLLAWARGRFGLGALALGAAAPALVAAVGLAFLAPLGAHNFQWPVLLALAAVALVSDVGPYDRPRPLQWIGALLLVAVMAALVVPLTEFVWLALSFRAAAVIGGLVATWLLLALPLMDTLRELGSGWAPLLGLALAAGFVGIGIAHARPSPERPAPSTLVYVLDQAAGDAVWATQGDGPGAEWVEVRAGPFGDAPDLAGVLAVQGPWRTSAAPVAEVRSPDVVVEPEVATGAATDAARRAVTIRSGIGAEEVVVRIPATEHHSIVELNGAALPAGDPDEAGVRVVRHWGTPADTAGMRLLLERSGGSGSGAGLVLEVVESHYRPGELVGHRWFLRPPSLALDITTASDRAVIRTPVTLGPSGE